MAEEYGRYLAKQIIEGKKELKEVGDEVKSIKRTEIAIDAFNGLINELHESMMIKDASNAITMAHRFFLRRFAKDQIEEKRYLDLDNKLAETAIMIGDYFNAFHIYDGMKEIEKALNIGDMLLAQNRPEEALYVYEHFIQHFSERYKTEQEFVRKFLKKQGIKPARGIKRYHLSTSAILYSPGQQKILIELPDHLRKTADTVYKAGRASAEYIAEQTGRVRSVESQYANILVTMEILDKEKEGRIVYFSPSKKFLKK